MSTSNLYALPNPSGSGDFAITSPATQAGAPITGLAGAKSVSLQVAFGYGSGGTNMTYYFQTSLDQGNTWIDLCAHTLTTSGATEVWNFQSNASIGPVSPSDASMSSGSKQDGILGDRFRLKVVSTGTYANTTVAGRVVVRT